MLLFYVAYGAVMTLSLANVILLLWLGFMVLINAERRSWGVWLIGGSLLVGGAFFVSHTLILAVNPTSLEGALSIFWYVGLGAVVSLPFAWYVAILWYSGFWDKHDSALRRRHRWFFALSLLVVLVLWGLLLFANPFPSYAQAIRLEIAPTPMLFGYPLLLLAYPPGVLLTVGLSLDALLRPGPARRMMGEFARKRAQPWLIATSLILLIVDGMVGWVMLRVFRQAFSFNYQRVDEVVRIANFDLAITASITLAVMCLGQAVARYEVFTGKTLPQQRFMRQWRDAVLLAFGFGGLMTFCLLFGVPLIYVVLITGLLATLFYALLSRSSYLERTRYIRYLRPFVSSQRLYEHMTRQPTAFDVATPFSALCREVLGVKQAFLLPAGAFAPLIGQPIAYPPELKAPLLLDLPEQFSTAQTICVSIDPAQYNGAAWAVPLWSERGLIGVLLLGDKLNRSLYTQEEIEIARSSGERLIDTQASAEMSRRLMGIQRERLAQSQVIDRRTRRMLHDEVLPRLHAAMLMLPPESGEIVSELGEIHRQIADLLHQSVAAPEVAQMGLIPALRKSLDGELSGAFDSVSWAVDPAAETDAAEIPVLTAEVLYYAAREAMRNAAIYGRGGHPRRPLNLTIEITRGDGLHIRVEDDGVGVEQTHGSPNGSGHGMALHSTMMAVIGGSLTVESVPDQFTRVLLYLPLE